MLPDWWYHQNHMQKLAALLHHLVEIHAVVSAKEHALPYCRNLEDTLSLVQEVVLEIVALVVVQVVVLEKVVRLNVQVSLVDMEVVLELSQEVDLQVESVLH